MARRLSAAGHVVVGVDVVPARYGSMFGVQEVRVDLRDRAATEAVFRQFEPSAVFHMAADMGGMDFIEREELAVLSNNSAIDHNVFAASAACGAERVVYSSSVCVYRDMASEEPELDESQAYPASPDNEYGWEKLFAERLLAAYGRQGAFEPRIARFQNCYGPQGAWHGGREKAPAALCRKAASAPEGGSLEIYGDGKARRNFIYVDDLVDALLLLYRSDRAEPTNIGTREYVTVQELAMKVIKASGKNLLVRNVSGPVGVRSRQFSNLAIETLGFRPTIGLDEGIRLTYSWIGPLVADRKVQLASNES